MLQELERVGRSWERAKALAKNRVHWRVQLDAPLSPILGFIKDNADDRRHAIKIKT